MLAALTLAALATAPTEPEPTAAATDGHGLFGRRPTGRNAVTLQATAPVPDFGISAGFDRVLGRRVSLGAAVEYSLPRLGYAHLTGLSETANGRLWVGHPFHGIFVEGSVTFAHQFLSRAPQLSRTSVAPGAALGFRWTFANGASVGASGGLRRGYRVVSSPVLCTRSEYCGATRVGTFGRLTLDIGWVF